MLLLLLQSTSDDDNVDAECTQCAPCHYCYIVYEHGLDNIMKPMSNGETSSKTSRRSKPISIHYVTFIHGSLITTISMRCFSVLLTMRLYMSRNIATYLELNLTDNSSLQCSNLNQITQIMKKNK